MARIGILLVLAFALLGGSAAALGPFQPDVTIAERGDAVSVGDDLYNADAAGQTRSVIVQDRVVLVVRVQNDGTGNCSYSVQASPAAGGFTVRYRQGRKNVTGDIQHGNLVLENVRPGETRTLTVVITAEPAAPLGAEQQILVIARSTTEADQVDAARADVTKVSEPGR